MRIVVTDCDHDSMIQEGEVFDKAGMTCTHLVCKTKDDLIEQAKGGEIVMTQYSSFNRRVIEALRPGLKLILRYGVGVNTIDLEAATQLGVQVCNVPDCGMNGVTDQAMGMMLSLARRIYEMNNCIKHKTWNYAGAIPAHRIPGSAVGIVGFGRIGHIFAEKMTGFSCGRIACDPVYEGGSVHEGMGTATLDTLLRESGMISVHCPLPPETMNMINMEAFRKMKPTTYLINIVRGGIINEGDLLTALQERMIAGATLDVVSEEPVEVGAVLFEFDNFLCSPYVTWYSQESALELKRKIAEEAVRFVRGEPVMYPVSHL